MLGVYDGHLLLARYMLNLPSIPRLFLLFWDWCTHAQIKNLFYCPLYLVDTRPSPAIPAIECWPDPGDEARPRLPCNLRTRPSKNFGRPGNEATGLLNLQLKLAVLLQFLLFVVSISTLKYPLTFSSFLPLLVA